MNVSPATAWGVVWLTFPWGSVSGSCRQKKPVSDEIPRLTHTGQLRRKTEVKLRLPDQTRRGLTAVEPMGSNPPCLKSSRSIRLQGPLGSEDKTRGWVSTHTLSRIHLFIHLTDRV